MAIGLGLVLFVYPLFVDWRLTNLTGSVSANSLATQAVSDDGRLTGVLAGPMLFASSPLFGVGFGHYSYAAVTVGASDFRIASHNWYMNVLGEQGLVGVILWGALLLVIVHRMRSLSSLARTISFAVFGAVIAGMFFGETPDSFQTAALPIIVLCATFVADWGRPPLPKREATEASGGGRPSGQAGMGVG